VFNYPVIVLFEAVFRFESQLQLRLYLVYLPQLNGEDGSGYVRTVADGTFMKSSARVRVEKYRNALSLKHTGNNMRKYLLPLSVAALAAASSSAFAAQTSDNFNASITIQSTCAVAAGDLNFGNVGLITGTETATATVEVTCTGNTAYTLSFSSASTTDPLTVVSSISSAMSNGTEEVDYTATLSATGGTGTDTFSINGALPVQPSPSAGTYTDTNTVYVTY
jgi:spore coat protein U-like protein